MFRIVFALMLAVSTAAGAVEFQVKNCTSGNLQLLAYNDDDEIMLIDASNATLSRGQTGSLRCATGRCKVRTPHLPEKQTLGTFGASICVITGFQYQPQATSFDYVDCISPRC
jgi:hypothetical protein